MIENASCIINSRRKGVCLQTLKNDSLKKFEKHVPFSKGVNTDVA